MFTIDGHCDALSKLLMNPMSDFSDESVLDVTINRLQSANIMLQCFALYVPEKFYPANFETILKLVDIYYRQIISYPQIIPIRSKSDLYKLTPGTNIGALLTLEGVEALEGNMMYLRILHYLGLRVLGITWNHANWAADGVGEPRGGGLTRLGKQLVSECEKMGILLDVSHLSQNAFWDLADIAQTPFFASHSNVYERCRHPRNLNKNQIAEIIRIDGCIGLTFAPQFVKKERPATIVDLLHHIEYICALGGADHLAFGSDFDGIDHWIPGLEHPGKYTKFQNVLLSHYQQSDVEKWMYKNWYRYLHNLKDHN